MDLHAMSDSHALLASLTRLHKRICYLESLAMPKPNFDLPTLDSILPILEEIPTLSDLKMIVDRYDMKVIKGTGASEVMGRVISKIYRKFEIHRNAGSYTVKITKDVEHTKEERAKFYDLDTLLFGLETRFAYIDVYNLDIHNDYTTYGAWRDGVMNYNNDPDKN